MTRDQDACGLIQTRHTVPGSILYQNYWYRSGVNQTMTAEPARDRSPGGGAHRPVGGRPGGGHRLQRRHSPRRLREPRRRLPGLRSLRRDRARHRQGVRGGARLLQRRPPAPAQADRRAKVITSIAMFYDLENPATFVQDVADALADDGVWVMELHYLPLMLESNAFDVVVHEHLEYYSLAVLERLFAEAGLEVVDAELNDMNGGSIRLFIAPAGRRQPTRRRRGAPSEAADPGVRDGAGCAGALRGVRAQRGAGSRRAPGALRVARGRRQDDPRVRRLHQGQHDPPVRGPGQPR